MRSVQELVDKEDLFLGHGAFRRHGLIRQILILGHVLLSQIFCSLIDLLLHELSSLSFIHEKRLLLLVIEHA